MASRARGFPRGLIGLIVVMTLAGGGLLAGVTLGDRDIRPGLALDLAGGTQIIMEAQPTEDVEITEEVLEQTVEIIRRRVDASGVAEAEITTQDGKNILVGLPGTPSEETLELVRRSAQLQFRPVIYADPSGVATAIGELFDFSAGAADGTASDYALITPEVETQFAELSCASPEAYLGGDPGDPDLPFVSCGELTGEKFILGPVVLAGTDVADATPGPLFSHTGTIVPGQFQVALDFTSEGSGKFDDVADLLFDLPGNRNRFAMTLDGVVISAPTVNARSFGGSAVISGNFTTPESAETLANQLKFGALPVTLEVQSDIRVGATLGAAELTRGLLAGAIGLALVVVYSLIQYRALGAVTVASLLIAAGLTYATIVLLHWGIGYRLSLAGVAGLIVAIGITADSFIVYFERVRDELRDGRSLVASVEHAWVRARRTILASDAVSLLAAGVLYSTAVGNVRGFAFTLGLTTIIDVIVVFLFTHPMLSLLARTRFFGDGHPASGLDPRQLGREAIYKGRGRVRTTGMTLAEKRAATGGDSS